MLIAAKNMLQIDIMKKQLGNEFEMKDLGTAKKILGMEITRDRSVGKFFLSQQSYVEKVLQRFNISNAKPLIVRLPTHFKLSTSMPPKTNEDIKHMSSVSYSSIVGRAACMQWFALVLIFLM